MTDTVRPAEVTVERHVKASPETVFEFFTDPDKWLRWQGIDATVEAWPGGTFRMDVRGDGYASGRFVIVEPPHRLVFTWGWEMPDNPVPPGSSTVEVELIERDDGTLVRLTHRDLPPETCDVHRIGWEHYVGRLAVVAEGHDAGPDPWLAALPDPPPDPAAGR
jgi:uncharacterized protein YndB with AHSA1/START domain